MEVVIMERLVQLAAKGLALMALLYGCVAAPDPALQMSWYNETTLQLTNNNGIFLQNGEPFTGMVYRLVPNTKDTIAVSAFLFGKEDGEWRKYFGNGRLMEKRYYVAGLKTGLYMAWWPDGAPRLLYHFKEGEYEGPCKDWAANGTLISEMNYSKGYETGSQKQYYENGKIKANYIVQNGRRYGLLGTKNCVNVSDSIFKK